LPFHCQIKEDIIASKKEKKGKVEKKYKNQEKRHDRNSQSSGPWVE
jgi:hypothetical protein